MVAHLSWLDVHMLVPPMPACISQSCIWQLDMISTAQQSADHLIMVLQILMQVEQGGTIDPFLFADKDGSKWLLSKNDGNAVGQPTWISICAMTPDGLQVHHLLTHGHD